MKNSWNHLYPLSKLSFMTCFERVHQLSENNFLRSIIARIFIRVGWNIQIKINNIKEILKVYLINSITKSYILNIKIRPIVTEYAFIIKLVDGTYSAHSLNPYAYFVHSWSYFDIQNLRLVIIFSMKNSWNHLYPLSKLSFMTCFERVQQLSENNFLRKIVEISKIKIL
jgi:hypothetical protein